MMMKYVRYLGSLAILGLFGLSDICFAVKRVPQSVRTTTRAQKDVSGSIHFQKDAPCSILASDLDGISQIEAYIFP